MLHFSSLSLLGCAALLAPGLGEPPQQDPIQGDPVEFATPQRLRAGDADAGAKRLYPSPVLHDVNGDQLPDLVVGDLSGRVTVALRQPSEGGAVVYDAEQPMKDRSGERLKFFNW